MSPRRSATETAATHDLIVRQAAERSSVVGLEGLTIGKLAADMEMSKAGVAGHFESKEQLQLEVIDLAAKAFVENVWMPVMDREPGIDRLLASCDSWYSYTAKGPFTGGCLLTAASVEFDGRPGPVRDAVLAANERWEAILRADLVSAIERGQVDPKLDPDVAVFAIVSLAVGLNQATQFGSASANADTASTAVRAVVRPAT